jgi:peptide/nickel transport system substrate-binding protein
MERKIVWLILTCLMVTALVLVSCGPAATTTPPTTAPPTTAPPTTAPPTTAPPTGEPQYGGTMTLVLQQDIQGFDEAYTTPWTTITMHLTNEELWTGDWMKGPAGSGEVDWIYEGFIFQYETGLLAESWENPEPGTLVFHIRKGVNWQSIPPVNGRELTAEDVRYSIERAYTEPRAYLKTTTPWKVEVSAPDKWTVVVKCPALYQGQTLGDVSDKIRIVAKEMVAKYGDLRTWQAACGTGPFTLVDYVPASSALFKKNPNYWRNDPAHPDKRLPYLDAVKFLVITDPSTRMAALLTARVDHCAGYTWEDKGSLTKSNSDLQWKDVLYGYPSNIYPRSDKAPFSDIRVRKAMIMAIDYDKIMTSFYGGNALLGSFPVAPVKGYLDMCDPISQMPESIKEMYQYNPDKAKQLLTDAGFPTGFKTSILCYTAATQVDLLSLVKDMYAKVGIDLTLDVKEYGVWYTMLAGRTYDKLTFRYCTFTSPYKMTESRPTSEFDAAMINDPKCNEYYDKVQAAFFNPSEFNRIMKEYVQYFQSNAWVIQMPIPYYYTGWWPWLKGYHGEGPVGYSNQLAYPIYVWIDQDLKAKMTGK